MPKAAITRCTILAVVGVTTLSAVACGSADTKAVGSSPLPSTTSAVASQTPEKINGEDEVVGSIASVSGNRIEVSGVRTVAARSPAIPHTARAA